MQKTSSPPDASPSPNAFALFRIGFRPFFLLAGVTAVLLATLWAVLFLHATDEVPYYRIPVRWHGHEMMFGYGGAVIAGFLLTAVRNWTDVPTPAGGRLAGLALLWLTGRILPWTAAPAVMVAGVDLLFFPLLAAAITGPLLKGGQRWTLIFPTMLLLLTAANLLIHLEAAHILEGAGRPAVHFSIYLTMLLVTLIGGHMIPIFLARAVPELDLKKSPRVDRAAVASTMLLVFSVPFALPLLTTIICLAATIAHGMRLYRWSFRAVWNHPMLWVLYLGYGWMVAGFFLTALSGLGLVFSSLALHAFTVGAIGVMTIGMMPRVSLGHTGRPIQSSWPLAGAFVLLNLAAVTRVIVPMGWPQVYPALIGLSAFLWASGFLLLVLRFIPVWITAGYDTD